MRFLTAVALALVMLWVPVDGVAQRDPLKGLSEVILEVVVDWDDDIRSPSQAQFAQEVERAFELGILMTGLKAIKYDSDHLDTPYLMCSVVMNRAGDMDIVGLSISIALMEGVVPWNRQGLGLDEFGLGKTWDTHWAATVGIPSLDGRDVAETCAEEFELEWRRANN